MREQQMSTQDDEKEMGRKGVKEEDPKTGIAVQMLQNWKAGVREWEDDEGYGASDDWKKRQHEK